MNEPNQLLSGLKEDVDSLKRKLAKPDESRRINFRNRKFKGINT